MTRTHTNILVGSLFFLGSVLMGSEGFGQGSPIPPSETQHAAIQGQMTTDHQAVNLTPIVTPGDIQQPLQLVAFECETNCDIEQSACWRRCLDGPIEKNRSCHEACNTEYRQCVSAC